jgi:hypothetical protein
MASLLDQMKKAGLVNEHKAKQAKKEKYQQSKQQKNAPAQNEAAQLAAQAAALKAEKDRQLNLERQQQQAEKAKQAELKQILQSNRLSGFGGEMAFHFADNNQVKTLQVNAKTHAALVRGDIRIARLADDYVLIPSEAAEKVALRDASVLISFHAADDGLSDEERAYYAKFAIPDDLVW